MLKSITTFFIIYLTIILIFFIRIWYVVRCITIIIRNQVTMEVLLVIYANVLYFCILTPKDLVFY
jgi:hypothetical protein